MECPLYTAGKAIGKNKLENCPRLRIEVPLTAFRTKTITLTLTFNTVRSMVMSHTYAKGQDQRSLGPKVRIETHEWTDGGDCITFLANAVGRTGGQDQ